MGAQTPVGGTVRPYQQGVTLERRDVDSVVVVSPEYSRQTGFSLNAAWARRLGDSSAVGVLFGGGADQFEGVLNLGFDLDAHQSLVLSAGQLRQNLEFGFASGAEHARLTQQGGGVSYRYQLGQGVAQNVLQHLELDAYLARTGSRDLADRTYAIETLSLYELWNDPRRIAGGKVTGLLGLLGLAPLPGAQVTLSLGAERLDYGLLVGQERRDRLTGGVEWQQQFSDGLTLKATADHQAAQNRYGLGLERPLNGGQRIGLAATHIQGRDGAPDDSRILLNWSFALGAAPTGRSQSDSPLASGRAEGALLDRVARRPAYLPSQVVAKVDSSAAPTRLVVVDKTGLPVGSSVDSATGDISVPLGVTVTGIAGMTLDGGAFANGGQFTAASTTLRISPSLMTEPAVGDIDTYVVTLNNQGGGTTLVTVVVTRGSVRVTSVQVAGGGAVPDLSNLPASIFFPTDMVQLYDLAQHCVGCNGGTWEFVPTTGAEGFPGVQLAPVDTQSAYNWFFNAGGVGYPLVNGAVLDFQRGSLSMNVNTGVISGTFDADGGAPGWDWPWIRFWVAVRYTQNGVSYIKTIRISIPEQG